VTKRQDKESKRQKKNKEESVIKRENDEREIMRDGGEAPRGKLVKIGCYQKQ